MRSPAASYFLVVRFLAAALAGGGAVLLVTRPDLVFPRTLGCSTMAGAYIKKLAKESTFSFSFLLFREKRTAVGALVLRALPELALGLAAAFFATGFLAVVLVAGLVTFLGAAFLATVALAAVFCET